MRRLLLLVLCVGAVGVLAGVTFAAFVATTRNPASSFQTMAVYPGVRSTSAWTVRDRSSGSEATFDNAFAYDDSRIDNTGNWTTAYSTSRWLEYDLASPLPAGLAASSVAFNFRISANGGGHQACYYLEARKASDASLVARYPASGDTACVTGTTYVTTSTALTDVDTTDEANDLRIRVYGKNSGSSRFRVERATVTGSHPHGSFVLYPTVERDRTGGFSTTTTPWEPAAAGDGDEYTTSSTFGSSISATRYVTFTFPANVPAAAAISAATVDLAYRSTSGTTCLVLQVLNGSTVIQTIGSSGSPTDCNSSSAAETITRTLSSVTTPAIANNLSVRVFATSSASRAVAFDLVRLNVTYGVA